MRNPSLIQDVANTRWLRFSDPCEVIEAGHVDEVLPKLEQVELAVNEKGLHAVGFLSYEASPAFDPALRTHPRDRLPLLWFALYPKAEPIELPRLPDRIVHIPRDWEPSVDKATYDRDIDEIKARIAQGDTYQVNYTFRLKAPFSGDDMALFLELMAVQQTPHAAYIDTGPFAICSASPELFFHLDGQSLTLRPMKGTAARGMTLPQDGERARWLHYSEKNRAENVMIVDMIRNDAGRIAITGSVSVPKLFEVEKYPTVWQMTSTVSAETPASLCDIMTALFPCASITGAPKSSTMGIISELETDPRGIYTGCIGLISPGRKARFNIAIRTVTVDREKALAQYGVGGGIVWDSDTEDEYEECRIKARVLSGKQPDFSLLETILWEPENGYFLMDHHLRRLRDSAEYFDFPFDAEKVRETMGNLSASCDADKSYKIRLLLSKNGSLSGEVHPSPSGDAEPVRLALSPAPVSSSNPFLYHKTTHRKVYQDALASCPGADDVVLCNERGEVTETTIANIVVRLDRKLLTPPASCGLLAGTFRSWLLERGYLEERVISLDMLRQAREIHLINSVRKWRNAVLVA